MKPGKRLWIGFSVLLFAVAPWTVVAEETEKAEQEVRGLWPVEAMMEQAAANISRRYNLNEGQREITQRMLTTEVTKFLDDHADVWPLIRDLARYQIKGSKPNGEIAKRIGERALPLVAEIHESILSANEEWRKILTDDQKKLHDWDLQDMEKTFAKMETNFQSMSQGQTPKVGVFPPPNSTEGQPTLPPKPDEKFRVALPGSTTANYQEDWWDAYVHDFIRRYNLDDRQSEAALSILRECKSRARAYRQTKDKEIRQAKERLVQANRTKDPKVKQAKIRVWTDITKRLNKPILGLFQELKDRLERIPSAVQRQRAGDAERSKTSEKPAAKTVGKAASPAPAAQEDKSNTAADPRGEKEQGNEKQGNQKPTNEKPDGTDSR